MKKIIENLTLFAKIKKDIKNLDSQLLEVKKDNHTKTEKLLSDYKSFASDLLNLKTDYAKNIETHNHSSVSIKNIDSKLQNLESNLNEKNVLLQNHLEKHEDQIKTIISKEKDVKVDIDLAYKKLSNINSIIQENEQIKNDSDQLFLNKISIVEKNLKDNTKNIESLKLSYENFKNEFSLIVADYKGCEERIYNGLLRKLDHDLNRNLLNSLHSELEKKRCIPYHQWDNTRLRFENPDGSWGKWVDLQGPPGEAGEQMVVRGGGSGQPIITRVATLLRGKQIVADTNSLNFIGQVDVQKTANKQATIRIGRKWFIIDSDQTLEVDTGYSVKATQKLTLTLPDNAKLGDTIEIVNLENDFIINHTLPIFFGNHESLSYETFQKRTSLKIVCVDDNGQFAITASVGNLRAIF